MEFDQSGWRVAGAMRLPHIVIVEVKPKTQIDSESIYLLARDGKQSFRVNYRPPASSPGDMTCGTGADWQHSAEFGDMRATVSWWPLPKLNAQQNCVLEAFYKEFHSFAFNVPPPEEPDPESVELVLREYKIAPEKLRRSNQTLPLHSREDDLLRSNLRVVYLRRFRPRIIMYSPATSTLVVRLPRKEIRSLETSLRKLE